MLGFIRFWAVKNGMVTVRRVEFSKSLKRALPVKETAENLIAAMASSRTVSSRRPAAPVFAVIKES